jgi:hypothetical protein
VDLISQLHWPLTVEELKEAAIETGNPLTIMTAGGHGGRFPTHSQRILEFQRMAKTMGIAIMARGGITMDMFFQNPGRTALAELAKNGGGVHAKFDMSGDPQKRPSVNALYQIAKAAAQFGCHLAHAPKVVVAPTRRRTPKAAAPHPGK